jgi:hypothetical protein
VAAAMCGARFSMMVEVDPRAAARAAAAADALTRMSSARSGSDSEADDGEEEEEEDEAVFARNVARCAMEIILADVTALPFGETKAPR